MHFIENYFSFSEKIFSYCQRRHRSCAVTISNIVGNYIKLQRLFLLQTYSWKNMKRMVLGAYFALIILGVYLSIGNLPVSNKPLGCEEKS